MNDGLPPEKVFRVLELIGQRPRASQRELANKTGLSLGLINLTLKRLIQTGHIKVSALDRRKLEYLLTPKGFVENTNRTAQYISRTLQTFSEYRRRIDGLLEELKAQGFSSFALVGRGEVASLVEAAVAQDCSGLRHRYLDEGGSVQEGEIVLDCRLRKDPGTVGVSILETLLQVRHQSVEVVKK